MHFTLLRTAAGLKIYLRFLIGVHLEAPSYLWPWLAISKAFSVFFKWVPPDYGLYAKSYGSELTIKAAIPTANPKKHSYS